MVESTDCFGEETSDKFINDLIITDDLSLYKESGYIGGYVVRKMLKNLKVVLCALMHLSVITISSEEQNIEGSWRAILLFVIYNERHDFDDEMVNERFPFISNYVGNNFLLLGYTNVPLRAILFREIVIKK